VGEFFSLKGLFALKLRKLEFPLKLLNLFQKPFLSPVCVAFGHFEPKFVSFFLELSLKLLNLGVLCILIASVIGILVLLEAGFASVTVIVKLNVVRVGTDGWARG
jgi:hypothetical protein